MKLTSFFFKTKKWVNFHEKWSWIFLLCGNTSPLNSSTHFNYLHWQFKPHNNNFPCLCRVCTDFWIQNFFWKQKLIFSFPDSRLSNRWSLDTLKNTKQSFVHDVLQLYMWDWIRFDQKEKRFHIYISCCSSKQSQSF